MTTTTDDVELHECACGCGTLVPKTWARGHWARGEAQRRNLYPLPGPDDEVPDEDEDLPDELVAELDALDWLDDRGPSEAGPGRGEPPADPPAGRIPPPRGPAAAGRGRKVRVTATIQRDVLAKIRMVTMPAAQMWAIRDEICGPVAVKQEPIVAAAFANIVCDSPDLLNWFTGAGGSYMKYFELAMALWPVLMVVWMHHIAHADRPPQGDATQPQQMQNYAA